MRSPIGVPLFHPTISSFRGKETPYALLPAFLLVYSRDASDPLLFSSSSPLPAPTAAPTQGMAITDPFFFQKQQLLSPTLPLQSMSLAGVCNPIRHAQLPVENPDGAGCRSLMF